MFNPYTHKIKTVEELLSIIGPLPRKSKVVMCHGVFDIVHPGHVRHLLYAKTRAPVLIASITSDEFILKGEGRPYVPEDLRASNLAALEMVDYVIVDRNPEPLGNITLLQPDFFVKGFEYSVGGIHPKSKEEMDVVSAYGGEFLYSPGDVTYSSTKLLAHHKPRLILEKLLALMEAEGLTFDLMRDTLGKLPGLRVHIVGDTIVDKYSYCSLLGASSSTPTMSVQLERSRLFLGGAAIVAKHLRSLGCEVTFTTVLGEDALAKKVAEELATLGIRTSIVRDAQRPTTQKERFWAADYKLLQVDTVDNSPVSDKHIEEVAQRIRDTPAEAVVFSDFRHGLFHAGSTKPLVAAIPSGATKVADSQVSSRWGNILDFKGFDLVTPNEQEARFALGDQDSGVRQLAQRLLIGADARHLILKLGERGVLGYRMPSAHPRSFFHLDSFVDRRIDEVGAGDALLAMACAVLCRTGDIVQSTILGSISAALECELEGNQPVERSAALERLRALEAMARDGGS